MALLVFRAALIFCRALCSLVSVAVVSRNIFTLRGCCLFCCLVISSIFVALGGRFNKKISSYQYRKSHCGDKTILRPSYLHNGISYTGKTTSLYWIRVLVIRLSLVASVALGRWYVCPCAIEVILNRKGKINHYQTTTEIPKERKSRAISFGLYIYIYISICSLFIF